MRSLAMEQYDCTGFSSATDGGLEITVSYWPDLAHVQAWKKDPEHRKAQELGKDHWYESYSVQISEVIRQYGSGG